MTTVTIDARYNGPPQSANGGYACGQIAAHIEGAARVRLHHPPPLDTPMELRRRDGECVLWHGEQRIASAVPTTLTLDAPTPPTLAAAIEARTHYRGAEHHLYPSCFVCGPARAPGDGLRIFAGPTAPQLATGMVACDWEPVPAMADPHGDLRSSIVWAALDCPSYFALDIDPSRLFLLGQMSAVLAPKIPADRRFIIYAWRHAEAEGRKFPSSAALADESGTIWARAQHVWIELQSATQSAGEVGRHKRM